MKYNPWTLALLSAGVISAPSVIHGEETNVVNSVITSLSATTLSGYVDTSAQWNMGTGNARVPVYAFGGSSKADGFNLNVVKLQLEKPIDPKEEWGAGYKVDLIFGPDANVLATQSLFGNGSTASQGDFAVKQAYVSLHAPVGNGLDFKLGVWDTIIGYEVFESVNNPNFTRSYGYSMEPTTHTGLQATYQFSELISATAAVADTFGATINQRANPPKAESYKAYMGSVTVTAPKEWGFLAGSTLTGVIINGFNSASPASGGAANQTSYYLGASVNTPVTGLKLGASYDYAGIGQRPETGSYANAVGGYVTYQLTEKLSLNGRAEYATASTTSAFLARRIVEATATVQYDLWKNVMSRLELRWDHAADGSSPFGGSLSDETVGGKKNSYILLANIAYKF